MIYTTRSRKLFFYLLIALLALLSLWVLSPFLKWIISGSLLAFIFHPLYKWLTKKWHKNLAAATIVIIILLIVALPLSFVVNQVAKESTVTYITIKQQLLSPKDCSTNNPSCVWFKEAEAFIKDPKIQFYLTDSLEKTSEFVAKAASSVLVSLPKVLIGLFIMLLSVFFSLKDGKKLYKKVTDALPVKRDVQKELGKKFGVMCRSIIYGYVVAAIVQGVVAVIGFALVNVLFGKAGIPVISAPLLWAIILTFFALIPVVGSGIVWVPMTLFYLLSGYLTNQPHLIYAGIFIGIYCLVLVANVDNIIRPLVAGKKASVHPLIMFIGVFGGIAVMGLVGIFLGPLILALLTTCITIYSEGRI